MQSSSSRSSKRARHGRIEGRRGIALRLARLANEPLCRMCKAKGRTTAATVPDHIAPLALGGIDTDDNVRCICDECHREVTAEQFGNRVVPQTGADGWPVH
jgi:5-methylcytosine-specific restriction protein A